MKKDNLKKTFFYRIYKYYNTNWHNARVKALNEDFKKEAFDVLKLYVDALSSEDLIFWLAFGTLLGCYREHDFIKHDFDLDTGAWYKDHERIKSVLEKNGFERVRYYYVQDEDGLEECYKHKDYRTTIDVFYFNNCGESSYCYSFSPLKRMNKWWRLNKKQPSDSYKWVFPKIIPVNSLFKGINVMIPKDTEIHLATTYGDSFMTPIPNFPIKDRPNKIYCSFKEKPAFAFLKVGYV